jgi:hypothetical protein
MFTLDSLGILLNGVQGTQVYNPPGKTVSIQNVSFPLPHYSSAQGVMLNGNIYVIGGAGYDGAVDTNMTIFNPITNTSIISHGPIIERRYHGVTIVNETIIVCGGENRTINGGQCSCEQYRPDTQSWHFIAPMCNTVYGLLRFAMVTLNGRVYALGGDINNSSDACHSTSSVQVYNGHSWMPAGTLLYPLSHHTAIVTNEQMILVCGGNASKNGSCDTTADCSLYNPTTQTSTIVKPMVMPRYDHSIVFIDGLSCLFWDKLIKFLYILEQTYIFGGHINDSTSSSTVELYSQQTGGLLLPVDIAAENLMVAVAIDFVPSINKQHYNIISDAYLWLLPYTLLFLLLLFIGTIYTTVNKYDTWRLRFIQVLKRKINLNIVNSDMNVIDNPYVRTIFPYIFIHNPILFRKLNEINWKLSTNWVTVHSRLC